MLKFEPIGTIQEARSFLFRVSSRHLKTKEEATRLARVILREIQADGDAALCRFVHEIDGVRLNPDDFMIPAYEVENRAALLDAESKLAIDTAAERLEEFFSKERYPILRHELKEGGYLELRTDPYERVGLYVPGGKAPYPSSVLMLGIPAKIAGVKERLVITPCLGGPLPPSLAYALIRAGIQEVLRVGGPHGVAAAALGTLRIRRVDKLFGPGNRYVTAMKQCLFGWVAIDMTAGPSEIVIIADESAEPQWVWLDALAQLEHGSGDELAVVVSVSERFEEEFLAVNPESLLEDPKLAKQAEALKDRVVLAACKDPSLAFQIANGLAPEHLSLQLKNSSEWLPKVHHAGAVFLGSFTPVALGDYALGTNHVLPTGGSARFWSSLSVADFLRRRTAAFVTQDGFVPSAIASIRLSQLEGFGLHAASIQKRLKG